MALTIEQILSEARGESPDLYVLNKTASTQPPTSSRFSPAEIEKMASRLKDAELPQGSADSFAEKLAAAILLNDTIQTLAKTAESEGASSDKKENAKKEKEEGSEEKVASFVKQALDQGYSKKEVISLLEKKAKASSAVSKFLSSGAGKALAATTVAAGGAAAGHTVGKKTTEEKAKKVMPLFYHKGLIEGYRRGRGDLGANKDN